MLMYIKNNYYADVYKKLQKLKKTKNNGTVSLPIENTIGGAHVSLFQMYMLKKPLEITVNIYYAYFKFRLELK